MHFRKPCFHLLFFNSINEFVSPWRRTVIRPSYKTTSLYRYKQLSPLNPREWWNQIDAPICGVQCIKIRNFTLRFSMPTSIYWVPWMNAVEATWSSGALLTLSGPGTSSLCPSRPRLVAVGNPRIKQVTISLISSSQDSPKRSLTRF